MLHDDLYLTYVEEKDRQFHGGYKWLITSKAMPHKAFKTDTGLERFLYDTGLKKPDDISSFMSGYYETKALMDKELFDIMSLDSDCEHTVILSNGDYTEALIVRHNDHNIIYYLNPNVHDRVVYDYNETNRIIG